MTKQDRAERLAGVVQACAINEPSPIELKKSIMASFDLSEKTALDYIRSLRDTNRLVMRGGNLVPGPNAEHGTSANGSTEPSDQQEEAEETVRSLIRDGLDYTEGLNREDRVREVFAQLMTEEGTSSLGVLLSLAGEGDA